MQVLPACIWACMKRRACPSVGPVASIRLLCVSACRSPPLDPSISPAPARASSTVPDTETHRLTATKHHHHHHTQPCPASSPSPRTVSPATSCSSSSAPPRPSTCARPSTPAIPPDAELVARNKFIKLQAQQAKTLCAGWRQRGQSERNLHDLVIKCQTLSRDLEDEIQHITQHQQAGSLRSTFRVATKMAWRQKRLDRLQKSIEAWEKVLERQLLQGLWYVRTCWPE